MDHLTKDCNETRIEAFDASIGCPNSVECHHGEFAACEEFSCDDEGGIWPAQAIAPASDECLLIKGIFDAIGPFL